MGNAFNAGGGLTAGSKQRARQYRNEIYAGRDQVSALISDMLNRQLSNISSQGANTTALAMQANARGGQSLAPGAVDTSGAQGFLAALPSLLQAQAQAYGQAEAAQINNTQDFLNNFFNYNQLRSTRKQPGFLRAPFQLAIADRLGGGGGDIGKALSQMGGPQPQGSDIRLKENVRRVGRTDGGLNIYTYNYIGEAVTMMGVMAQEVEKVNPGAVVIMENGYKGVRYDLIG